MEERQVKHKCSVCSCDYTDDEGGIQGFFGILPVSFCPTCFSSMCDMASQFITEPEPEPDPTETVFDHLRGFQYVVVNSCHGGYGLSREALLEYLERTGTPYSFQDQPDRDTQIKRGSKIIVNGQEFTGRTISRDDPALVNVVKTMGRKADGEFAKLKIVRIPAGVDWIVEEYDGLEWVAENHRTWE